MTKLTATQRSLLGAVFALIGYGAWAFWVNHQHGWSAGFKSALTQGGYSFVVTLVVSLFMETTYQGFSRRLSKNDEPARLAFWLTVLITCFLLYSSSWLINVYAGTPEVFKTVILGYVIGTFYTIVYVSGLNRLERAKLSI